MARVEGSGWDPVLLIPYLRKVPDPFLTTLDPFLTTLWGGPVWASYILVCHTAWGDLSHQHLLYSSFASALGLSSLNTI